MFFEIGPYAGSLGLWYGFPVVFIRLESKAIRYDYDYIHSIFFCLAALVAHSLTKAGIDCPVIRDSSSNIL